METAGLLLSAAYLVLTSWAGVCLTVVFLPVQLSAAERIGFGFFTGLLPAGLASLVLAVAFGFSALDFWLPAFALALGASALVVFRSALPELLRSFRDALRPPPAHAWLALTIVPWLLYFTVFFSHAYAIRPDGLYAGHLYIWGDWALHLSYASSFAYGHNFPPAFPVLAHQQYQYHFMPDFLAAGFVANGMSLTSALAFGSWADVLMLILVLYCAAARLAESAAAGFLAPTIFLLSGGLGFVYLLGDAHAAVAAGGSLSQFLTHLPRSYTQMEDVDIQWLTPVLAYLVPQRSMSFGLAVTMIVVVLLWLGTRSRDARVFAFAGALLALSPLYHLHSVVGMSVIAAGVALAGLPSALRARDLRGYAVRWAAFGLPILLIALPTVLWMYPKGGTGPDVRFRFGWLANEFSGRVYHDGILLFWLKNLGLFIPLALLAHALGDRFAPGLGRFLLPFWTMFVLPNLVILQPWDFDNTKWFLLWFLPLSVLVAALLAWLGQRGVPGFGLAAVLAVLLCLSGLADVWRALDFGQNRLLFATAEEVRMAAWARANTAPRALFLTAEVHNEPIATLAGRPIFIGYPGWLWVFTLPYAQPDQEAREIYAGRPDALGLLRQEGIAYVVVGPAERSPEGMNADEAFFRSHLPAVYTGPDYRIYRVT